MQARKACEWEGVGDWELGEGSWSITWRSSRDLSMFPTLSSAKGLVSNHYFRSPLLLHLSNAVFFKSIAFFLPCCPGNSSPYPARRVLLISLPSFHLSLKIKTSSENPAFWEVLLEKLEHLQYAYLLTFFLVMKQTPIYFGLCIVFSPFNQI